MKNIPLTQLPSTLLQRSRIALYVRVASVSIDDPSAALRQEARLRAAIGSLSGAEASGIIAQVFSDQGESGTFRERPELTLLLEAVKRDQINVVMTTDLARLSRSPYE